MSNSTVILNGSIVFIVLCTVLCILIPLIFLRKVQPNERKDFFSLVFLLVPLGTFCLWLMWVCMYISQMNPMISPMRIMHKEAGLEAEVVKDALEDAARA